MPVDRDVSRRDIPLCHQILPGTLRVLVQQLLSWRPACAETISAIVDDEDVQLGTAKAQNVVEIGSHVGGVAMQVEQRPRVWVFSWNPPTRKLIALEG